MNDLFQKETLFWFCALAGTGTFVIQFIISLMGFDHDDTVDDIGFKWFSKQALTGFLMMFGWVGLSCRNEFGFSYTWSILASIGGGVAAFAMTALIFHWARKLHSPGSVFKIEDAIGKEANVYQRIGQGGRGKVSVTINHMIHEIEAVSREERDLESFTSVKIIETFDDKTVVVEPTREKM